MAVLRRMLWVRILKDAQYVRSFLFFACKEEEEEQPKRERMRMRGKEKMSMERDDENWF